MTDEVKVKELAIEAKKTYPGMAEFIDALVAWVSDVESTASNALSTAEDAEHTMGGF
jgi:hypothetical protein